MSEEEIAEYTREANKRVSAGEYSDAEYFFKKISKVDPSNWQAWYGRGLCLKRLRSFEQAVYCFSQVTSLSPTFAKGWYNLGFCQAQIEELEDALFSLNKAIKLDSSYAIALVIKAWIFQKHRNSKAAEKLLEFVKLNNPEFIEKIEQKDPEDEPLDFQIATSMLTKYIH